MSFGKARSPRLNDVTSRETSSPMLRHGSSGHLNLTEGRHLQAPSTQTTALRSRSLSASNKKGSTPNLSQPAFNAPGKSKIPVQRGKGADASPPGKNIASKTCTAGEDKSKAKSSSVSAVKSAQTTTQEKSSLVLKLPRSSTPTVIGRPSTTSGTNTTPRARSPLRSPGRLSQPATVKKPATSPSKGKTLLGNKKLPADINATSDTKNSQKSSGGDEEVLRDVNLTNHAERKPYEKVPRPAETAINFEKISELVNIIPKECLMACDELIEHQQMIMSNLIDISYDVYKDDTQYIKIENFLKAEDEILGRHELLKKSQTALTEKLSSAVKDLSSETLSLRKLCTNLENELESRESENDNTCKQIKEFSDELEEEREKIVTLNARKNQLEAMVKKHNQRIRELEDKSKSSDVKILQQSSQLKAYEMQLKQKDEKYQMLEHKFNHQAKQCRAAVDVKEKLEMQRESLEARVSDLKKVKTEQQNEHSKVVEKLKNELESALQTAEHEKQLRNNLEKELKITHERLVSVQEKSLLLAEVTEVSKATLAHEGSLQFSGKEVDLHNQLNTTITKLEEAHAEIERYKEENEKLKVAIFQAVENKEQSIPGGSEEPLIKILKSELNVKDETIENLRKQLDSCVKEIKERGYRMKEIEKKWNQGHQVLSHEDQVALWQEVIELRHNLAKLQKDYQAKNQQFVQKQLEVEQRDLVMREQAKVLQVREELLGVLRKRDKTKNGQMMALQAKLEDQERNADTVQKFFSSKSEQLNELYSTLEMKQRRVNQLEEEVKQLEAQNERGQCQRTRLEARIAELELAVHEKRAAPVYDPRCKPSVSHSPMNCTHYAHYLPMEPLGMLSYEYPVSRSGNRGRFLHSYKQPYTTHNERTQSVLQLYRIHSSHWAEKVCSRTAMSIPPQGPYSMHST